MAVLWFALGVAVTVYSVATGVSWYWVAIYIALDVCAFVDAVRSLKASWTK